MVCFVLFSFSFIFGSLPFQVAVTIPSLHFCSLAYYSLQNLHRIEAEQDKLRLRKITITNCLFPFKHSVENVSPILVISISYCDRQTNSPLSLFVYGFSLDLASVSSLWKGVDTSV